jgi:hypothetical protein
MLWADEWKPLAISRGTHGQPLDAELRERQREQLDRFERAGTQVAISTTYAMIDPR